MPEKYGKKVICLNDNKIFINITEAGKYYNVPSPNISACCNKRICSAGSHPNKLEQLLWMFYDEYLKMSQEEIKEYTDYCHSKIKNKNGVVCLNTNEFFKTTVDAAKYCDKFSSNIISCCKGKQKFAGKHPITNEPLQWMYYSDYLTMQQNTLIPPQQIT
jgi:hypothetical protein